MSLTPWSTFVEVCRAGSLSTAAHTLGYTQSAVSRQVAALEREVGEQLLAREPRGVRVTAAGAALLPHARTVVAEVDRARNAAREASRTAHLTLGAVPSAAVSVLPAAVRTLRERVGWTMSIELTAGLVDRVGRGELDLAVVTDAPPGLPEIHGVTMHRLFTDPLAVALPVDHPLAGRRRVGIRALAGETWVEDNPGSEALLQQLAARHGVTLTVDRSTTELMTKVALVAAGYGVALAPRSLRPALRADVVLVPLEDAPTRRLYAAVRAGRTDLDGLVAALRRAR